MRKSLFKLLVLIGGPLVAQPHYFYTTHFGAEQEEVANGIVKAKSGYILTGQTSSFGAAQVDVLLSRTDDKAFPLWQKTIGGFASEVGKAVVELDDESIVVAGFTNSYGAGGYDAYIFRTDKQGNLMWHKTFGGTDWDFAYSINKTSDGKLIVCGSTVSFGNGDKNAFILKLDENGNFLWNKIYGGAQDDELKEIIQTKDGGFIAAGTTKSYGDILGDVWITKFNSTGDSSWFVTRGGLKKEVGNSIVQDIDDNYLIAGGSESFTNGKEDAYLVKLNNNGTLAWDRFYGLATEDEEAFDVYNTSSTYARTLLCYTTREDPTYKVDAKILLVEISGIYIDGGRVGKNGDDEVFSITDGPDKGFALAGYTNSYDLTANDVFVILFDSLVNGRDTLVLDVKERTSQSLKNCQVYPSPFQKTITVETDYGDAIISIDLFDLHGTLAYHVQDVKKEMVALEHLDLKSGFYTIRIATKENLFIKKIVCLR